MIPCIDLQRSGQYGEGIALPVVQKRADAGKAIGSQQKIKTRDRKGEKMNIEQKVLLWREKGREPELASELEKLLSDKQVLNDRFYKDLEFGTGGLRGVIGVGTNCLNIYTIARATQGLAAYMQAHGMKKAAISYDSRIHSDLFAQTAACVLADADIEVVIVKELMPTPFLSFLTREEKCDMGIMITASHNPAKYNGYKVYNETGCQIVDEAAAEISGYIAATEYFRPVKGDFMQSVAAGKIRFCADEVEEKYLDGVCAITGETDLSALRITYTALNGTGYRLVPKILRRMNAGELELVSEQCVPDGRFPTCPYPNPEKSEALALGLEYAEKSGADLLLGTDPDADRLGIAVRDGGAYKMLSGNDVGVLLMDYLCVQGQSDDVGLNDKVVVKTIVTTPLAEEIAAEYGVRVVNVLTGFKYIGEQINLLEEKGEQDRFLLGFEESYGYLLGTQVRDKDAVVAALAVCKMAAYYKAHGKTLVGRLSELYRKYGAYQYKLFSYEREGERGAKIIRAFMANMREKMPQIICGKKVVKVTDYNAEGTGLPKSNVLAFDFADGCRLVMRPSGTEPLVKVYLTIVGGSDPEETAAAFDKYVRDELAIIE